MSKPKQSGAKLKNRRTELGMTRGFVARLARINLSSLAKIESEKCNPTLATLQALAQQLNATIIIGPGRSNGVAPAVIDLT